MSQIQEDGDKSTTLFSNNDMVCRGDKTKLLLITMTANGAVKLNNSDKFVVVMVAYYISDKSENV